MEILVGYTGFVGSNINLYHEFDGVYNSQNIQKAFGLNPDLCIYAGLRAEKFIANKEPDKDLEAIKIAIENIKKINPKRLVLISTIDVYSNPFDVHEDSITVTENHHAYGLNRYYLENWVASNVNNFHIIRLPALFGKNIKKNYIYDLINSIPSMLNKEMFGRLSQKCGLIAKHYIEQENGFYKCEYGSEDEKEALKRAFEKLNFSALNFTDSRGVFQFYNLAYLWRHIVIAIENNINLLNMAVEPIAINEIYRAVKGKNYVNELTAPIPLYNFRTKHYSTYGGKNGYIFLKPKVMEDIVKFVGEYL